MTLYLIWLTLSTKFNTREALKVLDRVTPFEAHSLTPDELIEKGVSEGTAKKLGNKSLAFAEKIIKKCEKEGITIISYLDPLYPKKLERLGDKRPLVIYAKGDATLLSRVKTSAFVGTRKMSVRGREAGEVLAENLISKGYTLISGVADGIDSLGAKISLEKDRATIAVLGVDIDKYYPTGNEWLIRKIAERGVVISEYPPYTSARYFATRNRIISALSDIVTVVEAPSDSGALITARHAIKLFTPVFALDLKTANFEGSREIIAEGANEIFDPKTFDFEYKKTEKKKRVKEEKVMPKGIEGTRLYIYKKLLKKPESEDTLVDDTHTIVEVLTALTELELDGIIKSLPGGKYTLK